MDYVQREMDCERHGPPYQADESYPKGNEGLVMVFVMRTTNTMTKSVLQGKFSQTKTEMERDWVGRAVRNQSTHAN